MTRRYFNRPDLSLSLFTNPIAPIRSDRYLFVALVVAATVACSHRGVYSQTVPLMGIEELVHSRGGSCVAEFSPSDSKVVVLRVDGSRKDGKVELPSLGGLDEALFGKQNYWEPNDFQRVGELLNLKKLAIEYAQCRRGLNVDFLQGTVALEYLSLESSSLNERSLFNVHKLKNLRTLLLSNTGVTDHGIEHIGSLTHLKVLNLCCNPISGEGLEKLSGLTGLEKLYIDRLNLNDRMLKVFSNMKGLKLLHVTQNAIGGNFLKGVAASESIEFLALNETNIKNEDVEALVPLKHLKTLYLDGTMVDSDVLPILKTIKSLKRVSIKGIKMPQDSGLHFSLIE